VFRPSRQVLVLGSVLILAWALTLVLALRSRQHVLEAGFWFEPVTFDASEVGADRLGGPIAEQEIRTIASVASSEVTGAFAGLRITFSDRRDATYRVSVVQDLRDPTSPLFPGASGESRRLPGLGGQGAVSFRTLANNAISYAPAGANRPAMIAAIGRGIGRAAIHEFAHQILGGTARIHDTTDVQSYEYASADRREQYYGPAHWDIAWPMLLKQIGPAH
jgi:hypothetical protein